MTRIAWAGVIGVMLYPALLAGQIDSARARLHSRMIRGDTTLLRAKNPVSRVVLETVWAATDTQRRQASDMVLRRPEWTSQKVLFDRLIRKRPNDPVPRVVVPARKIRGPQGARSVSVGEDTTIRKQRAADFRVRAEALARIQAQPPGQIHPSIATNLINELDSVGALRLTVAPIAAAEGPEEQEAFPEYVISLSRAVVRLKDPRSVRALALGGLATSREVQRFVAGQGPGGPGLARYGFRRERCDGAGGREHLGLRSGGKSSRLSFEDSVYVYARIVLSSQLYPVSFAYATRHAKLFELIPELDSISARATADTQPVLAAVARAASRKLAPVRTAATPADWLARLRLRPA